MNKSAATILSLHATAVVIRSGGVLLRGPSGVGKSALADALVEAAFLRGWFGRLVGDDRVNLTAFDGRLVMQGHPAIAGKIERRGQGVCAVAHEKCAILRLIVDIGPNQAAADGGVPRYPAEGAGAVAIGGIMAPRLHLRSAAPGAVRAVFEFLQEKGH